MHCMRNVCTRRSSRLSGVYGNGLKLTHAVSETENYAVSTSSACANSVYQAFPHGGLGTRLQELMRATLMSSWCNACTVLIHCFRLLYKIFYVRSSLSSLLCRTTIHVQYVERRFRHHHPSISNSKLLVFPFLVVNF